MNDATKAEAPAEGASAAQTAPRTNTSSIFDAFETNPRTAQEGVWFDYGPNSDKSIPGFKLSRMSKQNKRYAAALRKRTRPHQRSIELETIDEGLAERLFLEVFVDEILLDWRNIQRRDGTVISFNRENALALLGDPRMIDLFEDLQAKAGKASSFRDEAQEQAAGN
jgi:hypothetical protein